MTFGKVGAVILLVSDMETSTRFYRDVLNLPIKSQSKDWTEFFNRETVLALHPARKAPNQSTSPQGNVLVGFMVSDLEARFSNYRRKMSSSSKGLRRNLLASTQ